MPTAPQLEPRVEGPVAAPALVFIQGWPDDLSLWDELVSLLRASYCCVRFNLPNYPGAERRRWGYSHDEIVAGVAQCIRSVSAGRPVTLIAHDWGAFWAYRLHDRHPELVVRVVTLDIGPVVRPKPREVPFIAGYQLWLAAAFVIGGSIGDRMTRLMARMLRVPKRGDEIHASMNYPYFATWTGMLRGVRSALSRYAPEVPFMFVYGGKKLVPFHTQRWLSYVRSRPNNEVVELPDSGHWVTLDPRLKELVKQFLDRTNSV